jgi:GT2 family glycosyltransferase
LRHRPELSAILVNYKTAAETARAVGSLRRAFRDESIRGEVIVVDCASGISELAQLRSLEPDRLVALDENRGYAGGLNAGLSAAGSANLLLSNSDVEYLPGSLAPLLVRLRDRQIGAASPVQFADRARRIFLPTGFGATFWRDWFQLRGGSGTRAEDRRFSRFAKSQWRLWTGGGETDCLTGSVLLTRRDVFDRVGRFDERYLHEYEETEWEGRVRRAGYGLHVEAASRALHFHATSASRNPDAARRRHVSRRRFRRRHYGWMGELVLRMAESKQRLPALRRFDAERVEARGAGYALAVSPNPSLLPFAAISLEEPVGRDDLFSAIGPSLHARVFPTADAGPPEEAFWLGAT